MATTSTRPRKKAAAAPEQPPDPESTTFPIPGGTAEFWSPDKITSRRWREVQILFTVLQSRLEHVAQARTVATEGEDGADTREGLTGPPVVLTRDDLQEVDELQDTAVWALLKSWTIDRPLPETVDDVQDLPVPLHAALTKHAAKALFGTGG